MPGRSLISLISTIFWRLRCLGGLLLLEKAELAEVENLADRRAGVGDDFDQIEPGFVSQLLRVGEIEDAAIVAAMYSTKYRTGPVSTRPQ